MLARRRLPGRLERSRPALIAAADVLSELGRVLAGASCERAGCRCCGWWTGL